MNHYPRNIGDFIKATLGMSLSERGAYSALLDVYYAHEKPLPLDVREVQDIAVTRSKAERDAVTKVLGRFFELRDDGWHQKRADEEIAAYQARVAQAVENGSKGGRPKNRNETNPVIFAKPTANRNGTGSKANQNHNQNHNATLGLRQAPLDQVAIATLSGKPDDDARNSVRENRTRQYRAAAVQLVEFLNERADRAFQPVPAHIDPIVALLKSGATAIQIRQVIVARARKWKGDPKMAEYLRPKTLFNRTNFANYVGELVEVVDDRPPDIAGDLTGQQTEAAA